MVIVKKIEPPTCKMYDPNHNFLGVVNEYEFFDIRVQIKEQQLEGYYAIFTLDSDHDYHLSIDKDGRSNDWTKGTFDMIDNYLMKLIR